MKKIYILFLFFTVNCSLFTVHCLAQQGQWVWMNGDSTANQQGVWGTQGVYAPGNTPPALYEACEWTDKQGNFWLFGGQDSTQFEEYSDLWEFSPSINQWRWMKGPGIINQPGIYGTQLVAAPGNNPGARIYGMFSWIDTAGRLWMFGGYGYDVNSNFNELSDLWMYDIPTNEWTWMKGPNTGGNTGTWGTQTVEDPNNNPPCRCEASTAWRDANNNLWLFGGDNSAVGSYSDLWRFNVATNNWTWMKGPNTANQPAVYGTLGVEAPANTPSGRWAFGSWMDSQGRFYFFGGTDGLQVGASTYNDMWRYNPATNNWAWISGTNVLNDTGHVGPICSASVNYWPASRFENRAHWTRPGDNFQLFGGSGTALTFNDVWNYNVANNTWAWMSGTTLATLPSVYGTEYVASPLNHPGSRDGSLGWTDNNGNLWLFGGFAANGQMYNEQGKMYNDLWEFIPDTVIVTSAFTAIPDSGCVPLTVHFNNGSTNGTNYFWNFGDGNTSISTNPTHTYIDTGYFTVTLIAMNTSPCGAGADTLTRVNYIHVLPSPAANFTADTTIGCVPFTVNFNNTSNGGPVGFLWNFGDTLSGPLDTTSVTNPTHTFTHTGTFTITLIAYGAGICNDTLVRTAYITVVHDTVASAFSAVPLTGCSPLSVTFTNNSFNGTSFHWYFGDGSPIDTAANPSHIYTNPGTYTVTLVAYSTTICGTVSDSTVITNYIIVDSSAVASFIANPLTGCTPLTVNFTNGSSVSTSYLWSFGDLGTSTSSSPSHTYIDSGTFTVTLIAYGPGGCNDTITQTIQTITAPHVVANFSADTLIGCNPFTVHFTDSSNATNFIWYFGDGTSDTTANPTHTYTRSGFFTDTLIGYTNSPCGRVADTIIKVSYIQVVNPIHDSSSFTEANITGCQPLTVTFTNTSTNATSYIWTFGDGTFDSVKNPVHIYYDTGSYKVVLITFRSDSVCRVAPDTSVFEFIIVDSCNLYIPNIFSPNGDGKNDFFYLNAEGYTNYHLIIYNRWGEKLFESNDPKYLWNGQINNSGSLAPDGTYYYIFSANDPGGKIYSTHGYLTLIRSH